MEALELVNGPGIGNGNIITTKVLLNVLGGITTSLGHVLGDVIDSRTGAFTLKVYCPNIDNEGPGCVTPILGKLILGDVITINHQVDMIREFDNTEPSTYFIALIAQLMKEGILHLVNPEKGGTMLRLLILPKG